VLWPKAGWTIVTHCTCKTCLHSSVAEGWRCWL